MATMRVKNASGLSIVGGISPGLPSGLFPVSYDFYGPNTDNGLVPQTTGGAYAWSEDAVTASIHILNFDQGVPGDWPTVVFAQWRVVWLPSSTSNGVRLVHADSGPSNITQIDEFTNDSTATPTVAVADVTSDLQAIVDAGAWKQLGMQVKQAGGMHVYQSRLEVVWQL